MFLCRTCHGPDFDAHVLTLDRADHPEGVDEHLGLSFGACEACGTGTGCVNCKAYRAPVDAVTYHATLESIKPSFALFARQLPKKGDS